MPQAARPSPLLCPRRSPAAPLPGSAQAMGGVEGTRERMRVNLTLEVEGGMWMRAVPWA